MTIKVGDRVRLTKAYGQIEVGTKGIVRGVTNAERYPVEVQWDNGVAVYPHAYREIAPVESVKTIKVGDKVCLIKAYEGYDGIVAGTEGTVEHITSSDTYPVLVLWRNHGTYGPYAHSFDELESVESVKIKRARRFTRKHLVKTYTDIAKYSRRGGDYDLGYRDAVTDLLADLTARKDDA